MSARRNDVSLAAEAARYRHERNEARALVAEQNRVLLWVFLAERMADPADFTDRVDISLVLDARGRIVWSRVDALLEELLASRPHLAATPTDSGPFARGVSAVEWFTNRRA
ncbi:hypothetical protein [Microbacterium aurum]|uniref:hypothetical protein n=1 Tax=Microbacterium aurum TaxID=36805 RepID=UPI0028EEFA4A|nr:hypothetical protein [Microbacterium aurum]